MSWNEKGKYMPILPIFTYLQLYLCWIECVDDEQVRNILANCTTLITLKLEGCKLLTFEAFQGLLESPSPPVTVSLQ